MTEFLFGVTIADIGGDMPITHITIPVIPTVQERARHSVFRGVSRTYKSPKQVKNEKDIALFLNRYKPKHIDDVISTPVKLTVECYLPMPKSWSKKKREEMNGKPHLVKGDLSNYIKNIEDCITRIGIWTDDSIVYSIQAFKQYSEKPRWEITLDWE